MHVPLMAWETPNAKKGKNLSYQEEVIVYQMPLPKVAKTSIIDTLDQCRIEFGCQLSVRGRKRDDRKKVELEERTGNEVDKVHSIILKLLPNVQQSADERRCMFDKAERYVDAFLRQVVRSPDDSIYMFPPEDEDAGPSDTKTRILGSELSRTRPFGGKKSRYPIDYDSDR